jgi:hypothetical protein
MFGKLIPYPMPGNPVPAIPSIRTIIFYPMARDPSFPVGRGRLAIGRGPIDPNRRIIITIGLLWMNKVTQKDG